MNKLIDIWKQLGLNPKNEKLKIMLWQMVSLPLTIMLLQAQKYLLAIGGLIIGTIIINFYLMHKYQVALEQLESERVSAFIEAFAVIKIFLANQFNVYRAIEEAIKYVPKVIREDMFRLLEDIDTDKSIQPYVKFSKKFKPLIIEQLMIGLYQLDAEGSGLMQLDAYDYLFDQFQTQKTNDARIGYEGRLDSMNMWPLLGAGIITINLLFGIINLILEAISEL